MIDYFRQNLFVCSNSTLALTGYSKESIEAKDIGFYLQSINRKETRWLKKINEEIHQIFYAHKKNDRLNLEFSYELTSSTIGNREIILQHKIIPFELCRNGNLWLALSFVTESLSSVRTDMATVTNFANGKRYEFNGKTFVKSKDMILTDDEIAILKCLSNGMLEKQISEVLQISKSSLGRKKQRAYSKLGAKTSPEAIFLAQSMELI